MSLYAFAAALRAAADVLEANIADNAPADAAPAKRSRKTASTEQAPTAPAAAVTTATALAPAVPVTPAAATPSVPPATPAVAVPVPSNEPPDSALVKKASDAISLLANEFDRDAAVGILATRGVGTTTDGKPKFAKKLSELPFLKDTWQAVLDELEEAIEKARAKAAQVSLV
jgi:hypothetical protein